MPALNIVGGRVIDPSEGIDRTADLLIEDGLIKAIDRNIPTPEGGRTVNASGFVVSPGFIDLHTHLREPGFEYKESIASGTRAAARGGFTTICAMPNTNPVADTRAVIEFVLQRASLEGIVRVLAIGCVTKGSKGAEIAEMGEMAEAGAIGFSDDGRPVADNNIMRQALRYSSLLGLPIINHCEVPELTAGGVMNEGWMATRLGLRGIPCQSESVMVARDIALLDLTPGGRLHIAHASTAATVEMVRRAKDRGLNVTCEATPHHLTLTEEAVLGYRQLGKPFEALKECAYDTNAKVSPPLRSQADVEALVKGLRDGVVDFIATDHAPHHITDKLCTFDEAASGISGLETALGSLMTLVHTGQLPLPVLIERLTTNPGRFLSRGLGTLKVGSTADVTVFDPDLEWTVDPSSFASKGKNTPLAGVTLRGKVMMTIVGGDVRHDGVDFSNNESGTGDRQ